MDINRYRDCLKSSAFRVVSGSEKTLWVSHERFSMIRQPPFATHNPTREEIRDVFRKTHAAMVSFTLDVSDERAANSCLYLCSDREYALEKLQKGPRYDVRRGLSEFALEFLEPSEILRLGRQAYCDTLVRTGQSVTSRETFESVFGRQRPDRIYLGAKKDGRLAAFLMISEVEDWVSVAGCSADEFLPLRPNNALVFFALRHYLVERKFRVVSYGLSSVQAVSNAEGLHKFKVKMGFEALQIHRAFIVNPLLRPFANRTTWKIANSILQLAPTHSLLKKAEGALRMCVQDHSV